MVEGVAVVYGALSRPMYFSSGKQYVERFMPGCFTASLQRGDIICTVDHELSKVIGRKSRNTLTIDDNAERLAISCELPPTTFARDLITSVNRGDIEGMSFSFNDEKEDWESEMPDGTPICSILSANIHEVCFSSLPAYTQTTVSMRNFDDLKISKRIAPKGNTDDERFRMLRLGLRVPKKRG